MKGGSRKRDRKDKKKGGSCQNTGDYGSAVFGAAGNQTAAEGAGNLIKMSPPQSGGRRKKGGSTLIDVGVPLVLLAGVALNNKSRKSGRKGGRRTRRR
jgi:hypothetical protein